MAFHRQADIKTEVVQTQAQLLQYLNNLDVPNDKNAQETNTQDKKKKKKRKLWRY